MGVRFFAVLDQGFHTQYLSPDELAAFDHNDATLETPRVITNAEIRADVLELHHKIDRVMELIDADSHGGAFDLGSVPSGGLGGTSTTSSTPTASRRSSVSSSRRMSSSFVDDDSFGSSDSSNHGGHGDGGGARRASSVAASAVAATSESLAQVERLLRADSTESFI